MRECASYMKNLTAGFAELISFASDNGGELAVRLVSYYGSVERVLSSDKEELSRLFGWRVANLVSLSGAILSRRVTESFSFGKPHTDEEISEYFKGLFIGRSMECAYAMLIDGRGRIISCESVGEGVVNTSEIIPRRVLECAVKAGAVSVIMAHNHPRGAAMPSDEDVTMTLTLARLLLGAGVTLESHYIISGQNAIEIDPDMDFAIFKEL